MCNGPRNYCRINIWFNSLWIRCFWFVHIYIIHTHTSFRPLGIGTRGSRVQGVAESHNQTISGGRNWFSSPRRPANALKMNILLFHAFNHRLLYIYYICCMNTLTHTYIYIYTHAFIYVLYRLQRAPRVNGEFKIII